MRLPCGHATHQGRRHKLQKGLVSLWLLFGSTDIKCGPLPGARYGDAANTAAILEEETDGNWSPFREFHLITNGIAAAAAIASAMHVPSRDGQYLVWCHLILDTH
jgi:hypothetical protein